MTFSPQWNSAYQNGQKKSSGIEPSLLMAMQCFVGSLEGQKILELGCANAKNAGWILTYGGDYYGVDGSPQIIEDCKKEYPNAHFAYCDFTEGQPFGNDFDVVFDRAAICHNDSVGVASAMRVARAALKDGGLFFGHDWFSYHHSESMDVSRGTVIDAKTRTNYPDGQFIGVGNVHFTDEAEICQLLSDFEILRITENIARTPLINGSGRAHYESAHFDTTDYFSAVWRFVARKPKSMPL